MIKVRMNPQPADSFTWGFPGHTGTDKGDVVCPFEIGQVMFLTTLINPANMKTHTRLEVKDVRPESGGSGWYWVLIFDQPYTEWDEQEEENETG